jgi:arylsulfatase A-like enzyme
MAGVRDVRQIGGVIDGRSFVPLLRGEQDEARQTRPLVWHYPNNWGPKGPGIGPSSAIRLGDWKLIYYHEDQRCELFNLAQDLGEQTNLADKQPDIRDRLAAELRRYLAAVEAQMPVVKSTGEAVPYPDACERRGGDN